jgi:hypothetical protein
MKGNDACVEVDVASKLTLEKVTHLASYFVDHLRLFVIFVVS